jgi:hypothetical protein
MRIDDRRCYSRALRAMDVRPILRKGLAKVAVLVSLLVPRYACRAVGITAHRRTARPNARV